MDYQEVDLIYVLVLILEIIVLIDEEMDKEVDQVFVMLKEVQVKVLQNYLFNIVDYTVDKV